MNPDSILHYQILEKLGEGGMGVVYKARDTKLERDVAIKFLPETLSAGDNEKQRFLHEARAASALQHRNVCSIYAIEETDEGRMFIVMAYYKGQSLQERLEKGLLSVDDTIKYAEQIAAGLQKAHENDIVHRDLKSANIFITDEDEIKIIDFGLAKAAGQTVLTKSGTTLGTMPYMSPEQAQGQKVDRRTDIWSLGIVLYEMLTGLRPFRSEYDLGLVYSILNEEPEPVTALRSGIPMELEQIIVKCLEKEADDRYQNAGEIMVDLRRVQKRSDSGIRDRSDFRQSISASTTETGSSAEKSSIISSSLIRYGIPIALILIIGLYLYSPTETEATSPDRTIAVLPFENLNPDPEDSYFAAGIHEDIIIQLSRIGALQVIARSSVTGYGVENRNIRTIGAELGVQSVLEGSVRRIADRIRVSVSLTDINSSRTLWAESYDRDLTDVFTIQMEIAREIARALETNLSETEQRRLDAPPTDVAEAYVFYLRAREQFNLPGHLEGNYMEAQRLAQLAVDLDPQFAHAYALISLTHSYLRWFGYDSSRQNLEQSLSFVHKALELNPDLPEAFVAMGYYYYYGQRDYEQALHHFNLARAAQPNDAEILSAIGFVQRRMDLFDESIQFVARAIELDPLNMALVFTNGTSNMLTRRHRAADSLFNIVTTHIPNAHGVQIMRTLNQFIWTGDEAPVRLFLDEYVQDEIIPVIAGDIIRFNFLIGDYDTIIEFVASHHQPFYTSQVYSLESNWVLGYSWKRLGYIEKAIEHFEKSLSKLLEVYEENRNDARFNIAMGRAYAGLGNREKAVEYGMRAMDLVPRAMDAIDNSIFAEDMAGIYTELGMYDEAIEILHFQLMRPSYNTLNKIKHSAIWDPLRDSEAFKQLVQDFTPPL